MMNIPSTSPEFPDDAVVAPVHSDRPIYVVTDIASVGDIASAEVTLSDNGTVVGSSDVAPAFEWSPHHAGRISGGLTNLDVFGSPVVVPTGVDARGDIVGLYLGPDGGPRAFLLNHGHARDLGTLGGATAVADAINDNGLVVGASTTVGEEAIDAALFGRVPHDLGTAHETDGYSEAFAVNEQGIAVGRSGAAPGQATAAIFRGGDVIDIGTLGGATSSATDINNSGLITGFSQTADGLEHAFIFDSRHSGSDLTDLGTLGGKNSIAASINDRGTIVGQADTVATATTGLPDAFVDFGRGLIDLNDLIPLAMHLHWDLVQALAINKGGQIAGIGLHDGLPEAFLLTPADGHFA